MMILGHNRLDAPEEDDVISHTLWDWHPQELQLQGEFCLGLWGSGNFFQGH